MSCIYKGKVIESEQSKAARGGTEMMRKRLLENVDAGVLENFAIHLSRPRELYSNVKNIMWCHDLSGDPENNILINDGWKRFDHFVFVSQWQRDMYVAYYGIPYSLCTVIPNAIEKQYTPKKKRSVDTVRFIYHTTPHRGLEILFPVFDALSKKFENIHLDVFSSFDIYGWKQRDEPYKKIFQAIQDHPKATYHGAVENSRVLEALDDSHIFLYPCIWQETSCIALIEAIRSGLICIHPNYGALTETAQGASVIYHYTEDKHAHAQAAYSIARDILQRMKEDQTFFENFTYSEKFVLSQNNMNAFANAWTSLLEILRNDNK